MKPAFCSAVLSVFVTLSAFAQGTAVKSQPEPHFSTAPVRQLRKGVDSWPVIVTAPTPAVQRANALLNAMNRTLLRELHECDKEFRQYARATDDKSAANPEGGWDRKVTVKMRGPRFISMVAEETQVCSGSYPINNSFALVFDMTTGGLIDWESFVSDNQDIELTNATVDGVSVPQLTMPSLSSLAISRADGECKPALGEGSISFLLWPEAKRGVLTVKPTGLPHVVEACEKPMDFAIDEARKLGFNDALLGALEQAHLHAAHMKE